MRDALICVCNDKSLEVGLIICLFGRIIVMGTLLGLMICVAIGYGLSNVPGRSFIFSGRTLI